MLHMSDSSSFGNKMPLLVNPRTIRCFINVAPIFKVFSVHHMQCWPWLNLVIMYILFPFRFSTNLYRIRDESLISTCTSGLQQILATTLSSFWCLLSLMKLSMHFTEPSRASLFCNSACIFAFENVHLIMFDRNLRIKISFYKIQ